VNKHLIAYLALAAIVLWPVSYAASTVACTYNCEIPNGIWFSFVSMAAGLGATGATVSAFFLVFDELQR
jgi:hypothetical protein